MKFIKNQYYHIFNRTNNQEVLFRTRENYIFFLKKYRNYLDGYFETISYCLMPTHFHFLVKVKEFDLVPSIHPMTLSHRMNEKVNTADYSLEISNKIGVLLRSYTRAFNKKWNRTGNLFNQKTNAKLIKDEEYFIQSAFYIHQNPIRSKLVEKAEEWEFSSYQDYIGIRKGSLPDKRMILANYTIEEIIAIMENV